MKKHIKHTFVVILLHYSVIAFLLKKKEKINLKTFNFSNILKIMLKCKRLEF